MKEFWKRELPPETAKEGYGGWPDENDPAANDSPADTEHDSDDAKEERDGHAKDMKPADLAGLAYGLILIFVLIIGLACLPMITEKASEDTSVSQTVIKAREEATEIASQDRDNTDGADDENGRSPDPGSSDDGRLEHASGISGDETPVPALPASDQEGTLEQIPAETSFEWKQAVFGKSADRTPGQQVILQGITRPMRQQTGMLEASLIRKLSAFLEDQDVHAKEVKFHEKTIVSGTEAFAYEADVAGYDNLCLTVIFYPKLSGEYIFLLSHKTDNALENRQNSNDEAGGDTDRQSSQTAPEASQQAGNTAEVSTPSPQASAPIQDQNDTRTDENAYDATKLAIRSIPKTLLNYIRNRYDFQYSLYEYLYRNGHRQVKKATVSGYKIDGDSRTAKITLRLDDGSSIRATYYRDSNSYAYH